MKPLCQRARADSRTKSDEFVNLIRCDLLQPTRLFCSAVGTIVLRRIHVHVRRAVVAEHAVDREVIVGEYGSDKQNDSDDCSDGKAFHAILLSRWGRSAFGSRRAPPGKVAIPSPPPRGAGRS